MLTIESLRMIDFISALIGTMLIIAGAESFIKPRSIVVRIAYCFMGLPFIALTAHYWNAWSNGIDLSSLQVYALHVWSNCALIFFLITDAAENSVHILPDRPIVTLFKAPKKSRVTGNHDIVK